MRDIDVFQRLLPYADEQTLREYKIRNDTALASLPSEDYKKILAWREKDAIEDLFYMATVTTLEKGEKAVEVTFYRDFDPSSEVERLRPGESLSVTRIVCPLAFIESLPEEDGEEKPKKFD